MTKRKTGWGRLEGTRKWHYFVKNKSVCGRWELKKLIEPLEKKRDNGSKNCAVCTRRLLTKRRKTVVQDHHITYDPAWIVPVFKGEHEICSKIQWYCRKKVSKGFLLHLKHFIEERESTAIDLTKLEH